MCCQLHFHEVKNNGWFSNGHLIFDLVLSSIFVVKIGEPIDTNENENQLHVFT